MIRLQKPLFTLKTKEDLEDIESFVQTLEQLLETLLPSPLTRLHEAMRYSVLGGGKRLRPYLTWTSAQLFSVSSEEVLKAAAAIELLHVYSLVHDDLPCMDNADTRRGKPSCHKVFGETTAVLVGDALIPLAFETLSELNVSSDLKVELIKRLGQVSGSMGLVAGQMMDLKLENVPLTLETLLHLQRLKTGVLFEFSLEAGAILGKAPEKERKALQSFGLLFGQVFQMIDDLLDLWEDEEVLGKPHLQDADKLTFLSFLSPS